MSGAFEDPRRVLRRHGLYAKRRYSQNFLVSEHAVRSIVEACRISPDAVVVELGAGLGTLSFALAESGQRVIAVERDPDMLRVLATERGERTLEIVAADAKDVDFASLAGGRRVIVAGNLPYAITGAIFRNLVSQVGAIERAVLMVQREVRDRLIAEPDSADYGALTVFTQQVFAVETVLQLAATAFHPPPKVKSSVVLLTPRAAPRAPRSAGFDRVVRAAFQARRKTLRKALAQALGEQGDVLLKRAAIDGQRRGETLSIEEFGALAAGLDVDRTPGV